MAKLTPTNFQSSEQSAVHPTTLPRSWTAILDRRILMRPGFNLQMLYGAISILVLSAIGCWLTQVYVPNAADMLIALVVVVMILLPLFIFLRERKKRYFADFIAVIFWAVFFAYMLNFPAEIGARIGAYFPLRDDQLAHVDRVLGLPIPVI